MLLGHRHYDSSTGRFLTRDRAKNCRSWYVYCDSNPAKRTDANGRTWKQTLIRVAVFIISSFPSPVLPTAFDPVGSSDEPVTEQPLREPVEPEYPGGSTGDGDGDGGGLNWTEIGAGAGALALVGVCVLLAPETGGLSLGALALA